MRDQERNKSSQHLSDIMAVFDTNAVCLLASEQWIELFQTNQDAVKGKSLDELLSDKKQRWRSLFKQCISQKKTLQITDEIKTNGEEKQVTCIFEPFFHNDMSIGGIMIKLKEVSVNETMDKSNKQIPKFKEDHSIEIKSDEDLFAEDNKFRLLTHHSRNIICLHNPDGTYIYVSPSFENILGYTQQEMIGKNPYEFIHPEDVDRIKTESHRPAIENIRNSETEYRFRHKDGHYIWLHSLIRPLLKEGRVHAIQIDTYPVQYRKELEEKLRRSEEQFRRAFEHSAIGMAIVGLDGQWLEVNKQLCSMLGYSKKEMQERTFQDITHPEDLSKDLQYLEDLLAGKIENFKDEKRYFHKNGELIWVNLAVSMIRDDEGEPVHFITQVIDINERKKAEKELQQLLDITHDQNERLMNFAHIVSHNLRSHSSNISMLLELLEEEEDKEEQIELYNMIKQASANLKNTIDNLNDVTRIQANANVKLKAINLHKAIEKAISDIKALIHNNKARIRNEVPENHKIQAMPAYLESILLNLLTNAIKYSGNDSPPEITFSTTIRKDKVILTVADKGLGINLDKHGDQIFELYQTFHNNEDARGIGLFITKNQVEAMGGSIDVESKVGEGSSFFVELMGVE